MKTLIAAGLAFAAACGLSTPAAAKPFNITISAFITGERYTVPCDLVVPECFVIEPFAGKVQSPVFGVDLQQGANMFADGSFYGSGAFSGTIVNDNGVLSGLNLRFGSRTCGPGIPSVGCVEIRGGAASFDVSGGVPEPSTWALLLAGFTATGVALRRRKATAITTA